MSAIADQDQAREFAASLSAQQRGWLLAVLREIDHADLAGRVIGLVRAKVLEGYDHEGVWAVTFDVTQWDNGWFLSDSGTVHWVNGDTDEVYFDGLDELFTDLYGARGDRFQVAVDLRDGSLHDEDNADVMSLIPPPQS